MIEKVYQFRRSKKKLIEKIVDDAYAALNHVCLPQGEALPVHRANSNVYLVVVGGIMTIGLEDAEDHVYRAGSIVNVPFQTQMNVRNVHADVLEFFVVKTPNPRDMQR